MAKKLFYKIGEACKKVDVQPYVLRYWETEFDLLSPDKSKSGQRVYTEDDLAIIRRIKELLYDEGYTTVGAKKKLQAELAEGQGKLAAKVSSSSSKKQDPRKTDSKKTDSKKTESESADPGKKEAKPEAETAETPSKEALPKSVDKKSTEASESSAGSETTVSETAASKSDGAKTTGAEKTVSDDRVAVLESGLRSALKQAQAILKQIDAAG